MSMKSVRETKVKLRRGGGRICEEVGFQPGVQFMHFSERKLGGYERTDRQTYRHTDTPIAILHTPAGGEVNIYVNVHLVQKLLSGHSDKLDQLLYPNH